MCDLVSTWYIASMVFGLDEADDECLHYGILSNPVNRKREKDGHKWE